MPKRCAPRCSPAGMQASLFVSFRPPAVTRKTRARLRILAFMTWRSATMPMGTATSIPSMGWGIRRWSNAAPAMLNGEYDLSRLALGEPHREAKVRCGWCASNPKKEIPRLCRDPVKSDTFGSFATELVDSLPSKCSAAQVVGYIKGKSAIHIARIRSQKTSASGSPTSSALWSADALSRQ